MGLKRALYWWLGSSSASRSNLLLAEGIPLKAVQEVLGHSLLSTTAELFSHLTPAAFQEAADAMERALAASGS